jgi:hypothetical protein
MKQTRTLITIATILALIGVVAFICWPKPLKHFLDYEIFKLTYQFLLIVVVGGAISLLYKQLETEREQAEKQKEQQTAQREGDRNLQRELRTELVRAYHGAKKIRRLLRAKAAEYIPGTVSTVIHAEPYNEQMELLVDTQLDFEFFVDRIQNNPKLFSGAPTLATDIKTVESYLNQIIGEYEGSRGLFAQHKGTPPLSSLKFLQGFIGPYKLAASFKSEFKAPFQNAVAQLETLLTTP